MRRIFFIGPMAHHAAAFDTFHEHDVEVALLCVDTTRYNDEIARGARGALVYTNFDAKGARPIPGLPDDPPLPSAELLRRMAPFEAAALQMWDRENVAAVSFQDLRHVYLRSIAVWDQALELLQPDAVVFHDQPCRNYDFVLYHLAHLRGIATTFVDMTAMDDCVVVRTDLDVMVAVSDRSAPVAEGINASDLDHHFQAVAEKFHAVSKVRETMRLKRQLRLVLNRRLLRPTAPNIQWDPGLRRPVPTVQADLRRMTSHRMAARGLRSWDRLATDENPVGPFVYFPLHQQPERTTMPASWPLQDQLHVAEWVARSLPPGWTMWVKEHPATFVRASVFPKGRASDYYDRLAALPGVRLLPIEARSQDLGGRATVVLTGTGTSGWEALVRGRPVLAFGLPWYADAPGVRLIRSQSDATEALAAVADGRLTADPADTVRWAAQLRAEHGVPSIFMDLLVQGSPLTDEQSAQAWALGTLCGLGWAERPQSWAAGDPWQRAQRHADLR